MTFIETAEISTKDNLSIVYKNGYVELHDKVKGFLGYCRVWHDANRQNDEYFDLNGDKIYIDDIIDFN